MFFVLFLRQTDSLALIFLFMLIVSRRFGEAPLVCWWSLKRDDFQFQRSISSLRRPIGSSPYLINSLCAHFPYLHIFDYKLVNEEWFRIC